MPLTPMRSIVPQYDRSRALARSEEETMAVYGSLTDRRAFLGFLAASPLLAAAGFTPAWVERVLAASDGAIDAQEGALARLTAQNAVIINAVKDAITVMDFEAAAEAKLSPAHFYALTIGTFHDETALANREGFKKYQIRMRRLTNMSQEQIDQSVQLFGVKWDSPVFLCPTGGLKAYHPEGTLPAARAAKTTRTLAIMSGGNLEELNAARGEPVWYDIGDVDQANIKHAETTGCKVLVWTVDRNAGENLVQIRTRQRYYTPACNSCHGPDGPPGTSRTERARANQAWSDIKRVKDMTSMKLVIKGIVTGEDAELAVQNGADAVIVSTHAGHHDAGGRGAIDSLPEVVAGAAGKIPVLVDSGFRSGADVYKALALGAAAVGVGRPYIWGLASFGQEGVETVISLLRRELHIVMSETGATSIAEIRRTSIVSRT